MSEVSGIRFKLPEFTVTDFKYDFITVYQKDWFSINISFDSKEIRGTLGFRIKSPLHLHVGAAKAWETLFGKYFDLLIGFEMRF